jgi:four helix bundle protein
MIMGFKFEKLVVWQKALDMSNDVDAITRNFPKEEMYVLTSQMKRAADSVSLNIAEGSTGQSNAEFYKFLGYAIRSNIEVVGCAFLARRRGYLDQENFSYLYSKAEEILVMLNSLRKTLLQARK